MYISQKLDSLFWTISPVPQNRPKSLIRKERTSTANGSTSRKLPETIRRTNVEHIHTAFFTPQAKFKFKISLLCAQERERGRGGGANIKWHFFPK
jgi:hypothetical protein